MGQVFLGYGIKLSPDEVENKDIVDEVMDEINSPYYWGCANNYEYANWFFGKIIGDIDEGSLKSLSSITNGHNRVTEEDIKYLDERIQKLFPYNYGYIHYGYYLIYTTFD